MSVDTDLLDLGQSGLKFLTAFHYAHGSVVTAVAGHDLTLYHAGVLKGAQVGLVGDELGLVGGDVKALELRLAFYLQVIHDGSPYV